MQLDYINVDSAYMSASDFGVAGEEALRAAAAAEGKPGHADKPPGTPMANPLRKNTNVLQVTAAPAWAQ